MSHFSKTLGSLCQTANLSIQAAIKNACPAMSGGDAANMANRIVNEDYIPAADVITSLAEYFGIGTDMLFESPHIGDNKKKVYLAGPITGHPNFMAEFDIAHAYLESQGYIVFNPARTTAALPTANMTRRNFMDLGITVLGMCNAIALMPGWESASGCQLEKAYAEANRMQVIELTEDQLKQE